MKYGFIGAGNMGSAIINGMLKSKRFKDIVAYDIQKEKVQAFHNKVKYLSFDALVKQADIIVLAVKPQMMEGVLEKLKDYDITKKLFISIAAGYSCGDFEEALDCKVVRAMPNLNAIYGASITALCKGKKATKKDLSIAEAMFEAVGETMLLEEKQLRAFGAIAGASPAYTYMYADALAMAAVKAGLPRDVAIEVAAKSIQGSATTLLESHMHPDLLRDKVCSPGGTTIEGVHVLEEEGFKGLVMEAIDAVIEKDKKLK
ncbi:MAG: pyrroline-5-carboxylate reductase [Solobacterium sp.]|nr:pyrroline-5-carboxylate reductase [Solobacterium sp.]